MAQEPNEIEINVNSLQMKGSSKIGLFRFDHEPKTIDRSHQASLDINGVGPEYGADLRFSETGRMRTVDYQGGFTQPEPNTFTLTVEEDKAVLEKVDFVSSFKLSRRMDERHKGE
eukprot:TRINITY_DN36467_c0_g1_i1.p1 TRINITY_DN36467_c0_g1~~TRINITY_DN36467_c0_g1_i1.p1  ORF type:complete len:115 (-),score=10.65 TRINITY_DN36467_c0_g1_i1:39-383(-)